MEIILFYFFWINYIYNPNQRLGKRCSFAVCDTKIVLLR